ncbi:MAG: glycosyltransferase WbuB [Methylococcaceae bacterium]|nr:glycosyltransferase WbuB [Methylococcaceae bacterium]
MRILIHGINYAPELAGIGKYSGEMAEWLAIRGHEVRVVTAPPYYPQWKIQEGYSGSSYKRENLKGVEVYRCPLWVPGKVSGMKRILHLLSFAVSSFPVMLRQIFWRPEVVLVIEPPLFCAPQAWLVTRLSGAKAWIHVQDFEVDAAFDLGLLPSGKFRNAVLFIERTLLRGFDKVSTISGRMMVKLESKGVDANKRVLFPNWVDIKPNLPPPAPLIRGAFYFSHDKGRVGDNIVDLRFSKPSPRQGEGWDGGKALETATKRRDSAQGSGVLPPLCPPPIRGRFLDSTVLRVGEGLPGRSEMDKFIPGNYPIYPLDCKSPMRDELGIPDDAVVCIYSGNMGEKQGLEVLIEVAQRLAPESPIRFVLCGSGAAKERLHEAGKDLANILWLSLQPTEKLNDLLNLADIHLLPQRADAADLVMPSKLTGMLASGRPVIATAHPGTEVAEVVSQCGLVTEPGDAEGLAQAILALARNPILRQKLGRSARQYAVECLDKEAVLRQFERDLCRMG